MVVGLGMIGRVAENAFKTQTFDVVLYHGLFQSAVQAVEYEAVG